VSEVAYRLLVEMFQNHTDYAGALPGLDQKAWETFWAEKGASVQFGE
jgi:hypothetical protein